MSEDDRTFRTSTPDVNRAEMQGLGVGQKELNAQRTPPDLDQHALDPERPEPFENDAAGAGDDRSEGSSDVGATETDEAPGADLDDRNRAGLGDVGGDLGADTPPNVDVRDLGQEDKPQDDWGPETDPEMLHSADHTRRPYKTEVERGQGAKTRRANKDIISRRT